MDRSKVRIGLISLGIIAGLTLLLYLPVLIWSPPWGENGYYSYTSDIKFNYTSFQNGYFEAVVHHDQGVAKQSNKFKRINGIWQARFKESFGTIDVSLHFKNNSVIAKYDEESKIAHKILNPFTLWYIKWLEWACS